MGTSIRLSKKHGVNPSMEQCFVCLKDKGVVLFGQIGGYDRKAPHRVCLDREPCDECKGHMERGVIFISVRDGDHDDPDNPYRTGGWCVVRDELVRRIVSTPELVESILQKRIAFLPDEVWDLIGLPRGEEDGRG